MWKDILAIGLAIPLVLGLGGAGFLFWAIATSWRDEFTVMLLTGFVAVCAGGAGLAALVVGFAIGIPYAMKVWDQVDERRTEKRLQESMLARGWGNEAPAGKARGMLPGPSQPGTITVYPPSQAGGNWGQGSSVWGQGAGVEQTQGSWQSPGTPAYDIWTGGDLNNGD
jgi:hypothetical protein